MNRLSLHNRPTDPQPSLDLRDCPTCRDMGYTLPEEFRNIVPGIPAGILFRFGVPCECAAGRTFADMQKRWNAPIDRPTARQAKQFLASPPQWDPPPWSDPPRKQPGRAESAAVPRPKLVTQAEIDAILKQQQENQKRQ